MHPSRRHPRIAVAVAAAVAVLFAPSTAAADDGKVRLVRDADASATALLTESTAAQQEWMRTHYWRMRGYSPFFTWHGLDWAPPTHEYEDIYAIYTDGRDRQMIADHPDWILRDAAGRPLYIRYACSGGTCPQYAADVGSPGWRSFWIERIRQTLSKGYAGIWIDDINMNVDRVSDGTGTAVAPIDPRTGTTMTNADWRRYMAEFVEQIRAALPAVEIVHNSVWFLTSHTDAFDRRQVAAADIINLERGFSDCGIVGGTGKFGYETYLAHIDWLHSLGKSVMHQPHNSSTCPFTPIAREFELASYYLMKSMSDSITASLGADPGNWWRGWETDLGTPQGQRSNWNGLLRRDYAQGMVLVNQPGASTRTVTLPTDAGWTDLAGNPVTSVTLEARRGKVLLKTPTDPTPEPTPEPEPTEPEPTPEPDPVTIKPKKPKVDRGRKIVLRGATAVTVAARTTSAPMAAIERRRGGKWRTVKRVHVVDGRYRAQLRARPRGIHRYRAVAPSVPPSRMVRVRVTS